MTLSHDEIALLSDTDDDWYGLWEVDWHFNDAHPEWSLSLRAAFFSTLVRRSLVDVFFGRLMTKRPPLTPDAALQALADPASWMPPTDGQENGYYVTTSSIGMKALATASQGP